MKSYRKELTFHTKTRRAYINITPQVKEALAESCKVRRNGFDETRTDFI